VKMQVQVAEGRARVIDVVQDEGVAKLKVKVLATGEVLLVQPCKVLLVLILSNSGRLGACFSVRSKAVFFSKLVGAH
jgi:hypothetical protein